MAVVLGGVRTIGIPKEAQTGDRSERFPSTTICGAEGRPVTSGSGPMVGSRRVSLGLGGGEMLHTLSSARRCSSTTDRRRNGRRPFAMDQVKCFDRLLLEPLAQLAGLVLLLACTCVAQPRQAQVAPPDRWLPQQV